MVKLFLCFSAFMTSFIAFFQGFFPFSLIKRKIRRPLKVYIHIYLYSTTILDWILFPENDQDTKWCSVWKSYKSTGLMLPVCYYSESYICCRNNCDGKFAECKTLKNLGLDELPLIFWISPFLPLLNFLLHKITEGAWTLKSFLSFSTL